jgi:hypothetical protein
MVGRSTPEQQGMDSTQLAKAVDYLTNQRMYTIHSLLVIRNGTIVTDAYFYPFKPGEKHDLASVTKSVTSTLVGMAIKQGYIASVRQPVLSFFPGRKIANVDAYKNAMTIEDLLTMRAGLECAYSPGEIALIQMTQSQDYVQHALDLPMVDAPGNVLSIAVLVHTCSRQSSRQRPNNRRSTSPRIPVCAWGFRILSGCLIHRALFAAGAICA